MKKSVKLLLGSLVGMAFVFFLPVVCVPVTQFVGDNVGVGCFWNSGLMQSTIKNFLLIEAMGGITGFLLTLIFIRGVD